MRNAALVEEAGPRPLTELRLPADGQRARPWFWRLREVLATVRPAHDAADRGEVVQPELSEVDQFEHDEQLKVAAGLGTVA